MKQRKKRFGDRKDGYLVRDIDSMHAIMPYMLPNRTDNEAFLTETIDMSHVIEYIAKKNEENPDFKYTFFHFLAAAIAKTIVLRPKMNRFYAGHRLYDRKDIILSFTVKKQFVDSSEEALAMVKIDRDSELSPIEQVHEQVKKIVNHVRVENKTDASTEKMDVLLKMPRPILRFAVSVLRWLEYHGKYPNALMKVDPYYSSIYISNLGSIKMSADYHHLANWGTNSIFAIIGEMKPMPFYGDDGSVTVKKGLTLSMTIDERIADGFYFANSIKILRKIVANPELIDEPINNPVE